MQHSAYIIPTPISQCIMGVYNGKNDCRNNRFYIWSAKRHECLFGVSFKNDRKDLFLFNYLNTSCSIHPPQERASRSYPLLQKCNRESGKCDTLPQSNTTPISEHTPRHHQRCRACMVCSCTVRY